MCCLLLILIKTWQQNLYLRIAARSHISNRI
uniref:Uncharacterized protein n=1 Tax=Arundo donax TaxID=35708 RepID=A0A0A8ZN21_ARUDO